MKHIDRFWFLTVLFLAISGSLRAQQEPLFAHFRYNQMYYNPAYAGNGGQTCAQLLVREQYSGVGGNLATDDGGVSTQFLTLHTPINLPAALRADGGGIGVSVLNDQADAIGRTGITLSGSYKRQTSLGLLSAGLNVGFLQKNIDGDFQAADSDDPIVEELNSGAINDGVLDVGFGLYLTGTRFYAGISSLHLNQPSYSWTSFNESEVFRVFYLVGGYQYQINEAIAFEPATMIKFDQTKLQWDLNPAVYFGDKFWGGLNVRTDPAGSSLVFNDVSVFGGVQLSPRLKLGYNYDLPTSELIETGGSHEFFVRYCFDVKLDTKPDVEPKIQDPRFL
jgi:type IX secretion system PorP/SprF family membrane protein